MVGTVGKVNVALTRLPVINGFPQSAQAMVDIGSGMERLHQSHRATTRGHLGPIWAELYPQTATTPQWRPKTFMWSPVSSSTSPTRGQTAAVGITIVSGSARG